MKAELGENFYTLQVREALDTRHRHIDVDRYTDWQIDTTRMLVTFLVNRE